MANVGKDNKEGKEKDGGKKNKEDMSGLQKRVLEELAALRTDMEAFKAERKSSLGRAEKLPSPPDNAPSGGGKNESAGKRFMQGLQNNLDEKSETAQAIVAVAYAFRRKTEDGTMEGANDLCVVGGLDGIINIDNGDAARVGQAFGSPQKIALVRVLLQNGPQSGSQLEEKTGLTTGSLYHHLRELMHARVIESETRSRYQLTEMGRQTALVLLVQAARLIAAR